jgi:hypothetical protein
MRYSNLFYVYFSLLIYFSLSHTFSFERSNRLLVGNVIFRDSGFKFKKKHSPYNPRYFHLFLSDAFTGFNTNMMSARNESERDLLSAQTFEELFKNKIPNWLLKRCEQLGFSKPTLVQQEAFKVRIR